MGWATMMTFKMFLVLSILLSISTLTSACIGSGCVHDRVRDQFFWCSGKADKEIPAIKAFYGGQITNEGYTSYCTQISAMVVTSDPDTRAAAEKLCGFGHEDISGRFTG